MKEAMFYMKAGEKTVCRLCPKTCVLNEGERGDCGVRKNIGSKLFSLNYGKIVAMHVDPIEKKPLFHFWPGSAVFSIAAPGCNLHCKFCQNWDISQVYEMPDWSVEPEQIVSLAMENGAQGIAYTYSEPTVFFEFAYETARMARKNGLYNVWISNGMINPEPIKKLVRFIDAANIDLKAFSDRFYRNIAGGTGLKPVLNAIREFHRHEVWLELTTLLIPGENDSPDEIGQLVNWVAELDREIPLHFSRFHPAYRMADRQATPAETIERAIRIADEKLDYVYAGNLWGNERESTYCPKCGFKVIERVGYGVKVNLDGNRCPKCGTEIKIVQNGKLRY